MATKNKRNNNCNLSQKKKKLQKIDGRVETPSAGDVWEKTT